MKIIAVIPARYQSTRLPGKPLLQETGKYLVQHVYEAASQCKTISEVIVATDDSRIETAVKSFGGKVCLTSPDHPSGTDRIAEVAQSHCADIFVNVQGDEPEISPASIDQAAQLLLENDKADVSTLAFPLGEEEAKDPNTVKVVCSLQGYALYFSRAAIPFIRDKKDPGDSPYLGHIGIYAYRSSFLKTYTSMVSSPLENLEKLEQLRVLENGYRIKVGLTNQRNWGIDTREDYEKFLKRVKL